MNKNSEKKALIIVDAQYDFLEGGALGVNGGTAAMDRLVEYLKDEKAMAQYDIIVTTQDWHRSPGDHWVAEGQEPDFANSWPVHCAAETHGAEIYEPVANAVEDLKKTYPVISVLKGEYEAAYSGFEGLTEDKTPLGNILLKENVSDVDVVGIATDFCVKATAIDASNIGFEVTVLGKYVAAVMEDYSAAVKEMNVVGVSFNKGEKWLRG